LAGASLNCCLTANDHTNPISDSIFSAKPNDEGITVKGSDSKQKFTETTVHGNLSERHNIVFKLKGGGVIKPLAIKTKIVCSDCKKQNKSSNKYCSACGSNLSYS
jgi:hypothetical protein